MKKIITVGAGDYYFNNLMPAFKRLENEKLIEHIAIVDIKPGFNLPSVERIVRHGESLANLLGQFKKDNPLILLAHSNHMHVSDAIDLSIHGFDVAVEKPFALSLESLNTFLQSTKAGNYFLLEYYLMMKSAPLLFGFGQIKKGSFYSKEGFLQKESSFKKYADSLENFHGILPNIIGNVEAVEVDILEGEGQTGSLEHRGASLIDIRAGGGMIQDLGIHALAPIYAIGPFLGGLSSTPDHGSIQIAISQEYASMAERNFGLKKAFIAESYAQFSLKSKTGVPVLVRVGKYVLSGINRRSITIRGSKNSVFLDLNSCILHIGSDPVLRILKSDEKYYPVIRAAIDFFDNKPLYNFNSNKTSSRAQVLILKVQEEAYRNLLPVYYDSNMSPEDIFPK